MSATSPAHQAATVRCRFGRRLLYGSGAMLKELTLSSSPLLDRSPARCPLLQRPVEDVAAEPHERGHIEQHHQARQGERDGNRSHPAPPFPFLPLVVRH